MPRELAAFLELTTDEAVVQWQQILVRQPRKRQEPFLPVETLLCYGLFRIVNPHRFGGSNMDSAPVEVHTLAATFQRTAGSIFSKMLNLDGSRTNCALFEPELFHYLGLNGQHFVSLYTTVLEGAWQAGLTLARVPDYLDLADQGHNLPLLGQDELGSTEIDLALDENREWIGSRARAFNFTEQQTTRLVEQKVRIGQHRFARDVLRNYNQSCGFCGFAPHELRRHGLLMASHIKPWKDSSNRERLDPRNGVAACPVHDKAFDSGLLAVNGGLRIHRAPAIEAQLQHDHGYARFFGEGGLHYHLILPADAKPPAPRYLRWHKEHIYQSTGG